MNERGLSLSSSQLVRIILALAALVSVAAAAFALGAHSREKSQESVVSARIERCILGRIAEVPKAYRTDWLWEQKAARCFNDALRAYKLEDFSIRRGLLTQQRSQRTIMLWMVVVITTSGVALAGVQLIAAFRLASAGHGDLASDGEVSIEKGKISVKSSVAGLLILTVSLAFFIVYVGWVYTLQEPKEAAQPPEAADVKL